MAVPRPRDPDALAELLRLAAAGETAALARVIRLRHEALTRLAIVVTLDRDLAATAVHEAWPVAWRELHGGTVPADAEVWLARLALAEALFLVEHGATRADPVAGGTDQVAGGTDQVAGGTGQVAVPRALAGLAPTERQRLAGELAGAWVGSETPADPRWGRRLRRFLLGREASRSAGIAARLDVAEVGQWTASIPVRPVNADESARRAEAELGLERGRRVSVAVSAVIGVLVAAAPYLLPMLAGR